MDGLVEKIVVLLLLKGAVFSTLVANVEQRDF
jgi:hypothetical protein